MLYLIPLSLVLRKVKAGYEFKDRKRRINHLLFMDDLKLYGKNDTQIYSFVKTVHLFSNDIGMELGIKKCGVLILKRCELVEYEGVLLPDSELMRVVENDGYKYLGILEVDGMMEGEMEFRKKYLRILRLVLKIETQWKKQVPSNKHLGCSITHIWSRYYQLEQRGITKLGQKVMDTINATRFIPS